MTILILALTAMAFLVGIGVGIARWRADPGPDALGGRRKPGDDKS